MIVCMVPWENCCARRKKTTNNVRFLEPGPASLVLINLAKWLYLWLPLVILTESSSDRKISAREKRAEPQVNRADIRVKHVNHKNANL